jgi:RNA 3'-phosphate cyclase
VKAAANISSAQYKGGQIGSSVLHFEPGQCKSGTYFLGVQTAGATPLILHTVYLPLALRGSGESKLTITGGTHVMKAPCYHFLETTWAAYLKRMGIEIELEMAKPGFYPRGGGEIRAVIRPCSGVRPLHLTSCPELTTAGGFAAVADLPVSISKTMSRRLTHQLKKVDVECHIPQVEWSNGPGAVAGVVFRQAPVPPLFFAVGERGKPAEVVADEAAEEAVNFKTSGCPVDPHSADQIVLPLAFAEGSSEYKVSEVTQHLLTNIETVRRFVDREISCDGAVGSPGTVRVV